MGLLLVFGELRDALCLGAEEALAFLAHRLAGDHIDLVGPHLDTDVGVGLEVVVPVGIRGRSRLRGKYDVASVIALIGERVDAAPAGLRTDVVEQEQRQSSNGMNSRRAAKAPHEKCYRRDSGIRRVIPEVSSKTSSEY